MDSVIRQLHITIGATPQLVEGVTVGIDLSNELEMIKAAILYSDHVTLCSPTSSIFDAFVKMTDLSLEERLAFFGAVRGWFPNTSIADEVNTLTDFYERARRRRYTRKGQEDLQKFHRALEETWPTLCEGLKGVITKLGGDEILSAVDSGLLDIHKFEASIERLVMDNRRKSFIEEYVAVVGGKVSDKSTYPLFDEQTNSVISAGIAAGIIPVSNLGIARGKEVGLAADLFRRLPLFPRASVKEILDIRRELESSLTRFRSAMLKFSTEIKDASWDDDFRMAAETIFRQEVAPAIQDLEERAASNRYLNELTQRLVPAGGVALSALAISMSNLPNAALAALAIGTTAAAATVIQAYCAWAEKQQTIEQNRLYFYYKTTEFLENGSFEYVTKS